ncbi:hypothetical protein PMSM_23180 [Paenibacillus macquariensis subsp. macquariensis]|nr:hypothetical protein PMSM_23180 [Paenibacillus macquariensis subsp. macquariensis]
MVESGIERYSVKIVYHEHIGGIITMLNINYIMPYHPQYHRPQIMSPSKKENSNEPKKSFQDILNQQMAKQT